MPKRKIDEVYSEENDHCEATNDSLESNEDSNESGNSGKTYLYCTPFTAFDLLDSNFYQKLSSISVFYICSNKIGSSKVSLYGVTPSLLWSPF